MTQIQPADFATADYRTVLRRLTALDGEAADLRTEATRWHDERVAAIDTAVRAAEDDLRAAQRTVAEAQRDLEEVDARAATLWSEFVHKVGPVAERYGRTLPAATIPRQRGDRAPADYLDEVATRVAYVPPARPLTTAVRLLFGLFGFLGGVLGAIANRLLRQTAGGPGADWHAAVPVVALVVMLACPVLAVVAAKRVADRRGVGLTAGTFSAVLITGLVTAFLVVAALQV